MSPSERAPLSPPELGAAQGVRLARLRSALASLAAALEAAPSLRRIQLGFSRPSGPEPGLDRFYFLTNRGCSDPQTLACSGLIRVSPADAQTRALAELRLKMGGRGAEPPFVSSQPPPAVNAASGDEQDRAALLSLSDWIARQPPSLLREMPRLLDPLRLPDPGAGQRLQALALHALPEELLPAWMALAPELAAEPAQKLSPATEPSRRRILASRSSQTL